MVLLYTLLQGKKKHFNFAAGFEIKNKKNNNNYEILFNIHIMAFGLLGKFQRKRNSQEVMHKVILPDKESRVMLHSKFKSKCCKSMIDHALTFKRDSYLAREIREYAISVLGGKEIQIL